MIEAGTSGIEAGAVGAGAAMGAATESGIGAASVGISNMSMPEIGYGSISSYPSPEFSPLGSPIIESLSRPSSLDYLDSMPEPIVGDFDIGDIVGKPFRPEIEEAINSIQIEPATYLEPLAVWQIDQEIENQAQKEEEKSIAESVSTFPKSEITVAKPNLGQIIEPSQVFDNQPFGTQNIKEEVSIFNTESAVEQQTTPKPETEIGNLVAGIFSIGTIELKETEANESALEEAIAILESYELDEKTKEIWKKKLQTATQTQTVAEQEDETETQTEAQTATEVSGSTKVGNTSGIGMEPPNNNLPNDAFEKDDDKEEEEEKKPEKAKKTWRLDMFTDVWKNAIEVNRARNEVAHQIAEKIVQKEVTSQSESEAMALALDFGGDGSENKSLHAKKVKIPAIAPRLSLILSFLGTNKPKEIAKAILQTVSANPAKELVSEFLNSKMIDPKDLSEEAKSLIARGAKKLILEEKRNNKFAWKPVTVLPHRNPLEAEAVEKG